MFRVTTLGALLCAASTIAAQAAVLPIKAGDYVRDGVQCRDAPFATLMHWDGRSFSGPHDSDCTTRLVGKSAGGSYSLRTICRAAGDGSPAGGLEEAQSVRVLSPTHFIFTHGNGAGRRDRSGFRLCPLSSAR